MSPQPAPEAVRLRLDEELVRRGLFASRSRARDAILRGAVAVDGAPARKPGTAVSTVADITVDDPAAAYVSRGALKLVAGLDAFGIDPTGRIALDLGASTGGFTQVLLERGAATVFAVDVGHGQLDASLAGDARIRLIEGVNARDLEPRHLDGAVPDLVVCDVSFISLRLALPPALGLAAHGAEGVFLVKPQFEAGREAIGKGGLLRDPARADEIALELRAWLDACPGWQSTGLLPSPIQGGDGNREFLMAGRKGA
jgi:23S rRNA (cytidine1920-2'-O)/16S rRNA (cytidine1409-2'-O)-methyltransferase